MRPPEPKYMALGAIASALVFAAAGGIYMVAQGAEPFSIIEGGALLPAIVALIFLGGPGPGLVFGVPLAAVIRVIATKPLPSIVANSGGFLLFVGGMSWSASGPTHSRIDRFSVLVTLYSLLAIGLACWFQWLGNRRRTPPVDLRETFE